MLSTSHVLIEEGSFGVRCIRNDKLLRISLAVPEWGAKMKTMMVSSPISGALMGQGSGATLFRLRTLQVLDNVGA